MTQLKKMKKNAIKKSGNSNFWGKKINCSLLIIQIYGNT